MQNTLIAVLGQFKPKQQFVKAEWPITVPHQTCNYFNLTLFQPELQGWHMTATLYAADVPQQYVQFEQQGLVLVASLNDTINIVPNLHIVVTGINGNKQANEANLPLLMYVSYFPEMTDFGEQHEYVEVVPGGPLFSRVSGQPFSNQNDYHWEKPTETVVRYEMDTLELQTDGSLVWIVPYPPKCAVEQTTVFSRSTFASVQGVSSVPTPLYEGRFSTSAIGASVKGRALVKFNNLTEFISNYAPVHATAVFQNHSG
jgi:hypothetical protein